MASGCRGHADQPDVGARRGGLSDRRRRRQTRSRRRTAGDRHRGRRAYGRRPGCRACPGCRRTSGAPRRRTRPTDLHQRDHRPPEGRHARPRQPECHVSHDHRCVQDEQRRPQPAHPAAVSRQRNSGRHAVALDRRRPCDHRGAVQSEVVLRSARTMPRDVLLRGSHHLHHALGSARRGAPRHLLGQIRRLRGGAGERRATDQIRGALRHPAHRGLRVVRGHVREHSQPARRRAQTRHRRTARCRGREYGSSARTTWTFHRARPARF